MIGGYCGSSRASRPQPKPRHIWRGKVTAGYRFTFQILADGYLLRRIGPRDVEPEA